jgi:hypothetical protein
MDQASSTECPSMRASAVPAIVSRMPRVYLMDPFELCMLHESITGMSARACCARRCITEAS